MGPRRLCWRLLALLLVSLAIRLILLVPMTVGGASEIGDAYGYFDRALSLHSIVTDLLAGRPAAPADVAAATTALWPPFQSLLLAAGFTVFGPTLLVGRLMMVVLSALTAPLAFALTSRLSSPRAGTIAGIMAAIYPGFIHYSLRTFSETTYVFLALLMLLFALRTVGPEQPRWRAGLAAAMTGFLLGLATLTRAAGLIWTPVIALWVATRSVGLRRRALLPALILLTAGATLLPWELTLYSMSGRLVIVSTTSESNLYLGNNPWLQDDLGPTDDPVKERMRQTARQYSEEHGITLQEAYRALAMEEIRRDPAGFLVRGLSKMRSLWTADRPILAYILMMACRPVSSGVVYAVGFALVTGMLVLVALSLWGLLVPSPPLGHRCLLLALVLSAMATHFMTIAVPRFNLPLLAVLLPAAGHGAVHLRSLARPGRRVQTIILAAGTVLLAVSMVTGLPAMYERTFPSSYYVGLVRRLDGWLGTTSTVTDRLLFRKTAGGDSGEVSVSSMAADYQIAERSGRTVSWTPPADASTLELVFHSRTATEPLQVLLSSGEPRKAVNILLDEKGWHRWAHTGLPGIEYCWVGSGYFPLRASTLRGTAGVEGRNRPPSLPAVDPPAR